jgi:transcriptional regulator with XRE-family HTH domain
MVDLQLHKISCDKCNGEGFIFSPNVYKFFRKWRKDLSLNQKDIADRLKIGHQQFSKFETGKASFTESRLRQLAIILSEYE